MEGELPVFGNFTLARIAKMRSLNRQPRDWRERFDYVQAPATFN
jgi:hypothetical protein